ncbi:Serine/threonine phosphatase stp [Delftia tsuruhatensis]|uniref:PP2C family protein-serine/threonine phosphatase n=1 Tax=Delftia tsuruhatensis TaxID=180282 RepID=UPI001E6D91AB|nr:PP2C family serine/threonine-protein phosphatase [Delftia tsuruhatensis]CAB5709982.1 Serine/threonine phosphatase stp [Delftia tsuruhatensis]CAC9685096.1 Serine/threonine phosphatase stp [Delftia tsuruhatensis]
MTGENSLLSAHTLGLVHYSISQKGDRSYNEDAYCHARDGDIVTFAVADGMGGAAGGRHASHFTMDLVRKERLTLDTDSLATHFESLSDQVKQEQRNLPEFSDMCTTLAELRIDTCTQKAAWAHWGDTRIYWFRNRRLMSVTEDHSVVQSLVTAGLISEKDAVNYPKRNILLGALGANSEVGPSTTSIPVDLLPGDAFLICTDGLWSVLNKEYITETLQQSRHVQEWISTMAAQVESIGSGSNDNYTATGIWITAGSDKTLPSIR